MSAAMLAVMAQAGDPHRLADHHRGRLLYLSGDAEVRSRAIPTSSATPAHLDAPKTAFGLIAPALKRRRAAGAAPFTVMSCDNIPGNGHVTENAVAGPRRTRRPRARRTGFAATSPFPNSMVDRITPATSDRERDDAATTNGASRTLGRCSAKSSSNGWSRIISRRAARAREGRRDLHQRRRALRADEDPHPQRRPCGDRLSRRRCSTSISSTRRWRIAQIARLPGEADQDARSCRPCRRRPATISRTIAQLIAAPLRQSEDRRHDHAAVPRRLEPAAEVHPADGRATG